MRAPYQVLVFPYTITDHSIEYAIFKRSDYGYWLYPKSTLTINGYVLKRQ